MRALRVALSRLGLEALIRDELGQDLLEYAFLAALIAVVALAAVTSVGNAIYTVFWQVIAATA